MAVTVEGIIDIRQRGADPTGLVDSTDAINTALEEGFTDNKVVVGFGGEYRIDGTVLIRCNCDFLGATFHGQDLSAGPVVRIADDDAQWSRLQNINVRLPRIYRTELNRPVVSGRTTWPVENSGVEIEALSRSIVVFDRIENHKYGIHIISADEVWAGTDFNAFHITLCNNNEINLFLDVKVRPGHPWNGNPGNNVDGGWINENRFFGGALRHEQCVIDDPNDTLEGCYQVKVGAFWNNQHLMYPGENTFHNLSMEGNRHECAIVMMGNDNRFYNCRIERFDPYPAETIRFERPVMAIDNPERFANRNVFSGHGWSRLFDPADTYGGFESINWTGQKNFIQDFHLTDDPAHIGGGFVEIPQS